MHWIHHKARVTTTPISWKNRPVLLLTSPEWLTYVLSIASSCPPTIPHSIISPRFHRDSFPDQRHALLLFRLPTRNRHRAKSPQTRPALPVHNPNIPNADAMLKEDMTERELNRDKTGPCVHRDFCQRPPVVPCGTSQRHFRRVLLILRLIIEDDTSHNAFVK